MSMYMLPACIVNGRTDAHWLISTSGVTSRNKVCRPNSKIPVVQPGKGAGIVAKQQGVPCREDVDVKVTPSGVLNLLRNIWDTTAGVVE
jgi:hypothetical protein